jgi:carboxymethylenebutenolidase
LHRGGGVAILASATEEKGRTMDEKPETAAASPLPRRFMMTALMSGLTLATTRVEAQVIHTPADGIDAGEAHIKVEDGEIPAYYARPLGAGPFPVVLVNEEVFGVHTYIADVCRRLAKLGYLAVAPEIYARLADMAKMTDFSNIMRDVVSRAPDATMLSDLDGAVAWAVANKGDAGRVGVLGFCRGGRTTWLYAAHNPRLKAAVAFYGPVAGPTSRIQPKQPIDVAGALHCPLLGLYGGKDTFIRMQDVEATADRARAAGATVEIVVYPDASHAFHADYRPSYRPADAADAWQRAMAWLRKYGVG